MTTKRHILSSLDRTHIRTIDSDDDRAKSEASFRCNLVNPEYQVFPTPSDETDFGQKRVVIEACLFLFERFIVLFEPFEYFEVLKKKAVRWFLQPLWRT